MFNYKQKESYTDLELKELLEQHEKFVAKDKVDKAELEKLSGELSQLKKKEFDTLVDKSLSNYGETQRKALRKLADIQGSETPEEIDVKIKKALEEHKDLFEKEVKKETSILNVNETPKAEKQKQSLTVLQKKYRDR